MAKVGRGTRIEIEGLRDFQRDLRSIDRKHGSELRKNLKTAAEVVAAEARSIASGSGGALAKAAPSIKAQAEQRAAKISWGSASVPFAVGAIMGAKQYPQFEEWVGASWEVGVAGTGPRAVNTAIATREDELLEAIAEGLENVASSAFPR